MADIFAASAERFGSIVGYEQSGDSLVDTSWYDNWFTELPAGDDTLTGPEGSQRIFKGPKLNSGKSDYINGLSQVVKKGNDIGVDNLNVQQKKEYDAASVALEDILAADEAARATGNEDGILTSAGYDLQSKREELLKELTNARSVLAGGDLSTFDVSEAPGQSVANLAHQCFLLYNLTTFSKFHRQLLVRQVPAPAFGAKGAPDFYKFKAGDPRILTPGYYSTKNNYTKMFLVGEQKTNLNNLLTLKRHGAKFGNMTSPEISQLIPRLRIFKEYLEADQKAVVEFEFKPNTDVSMGISSKVDIDYLGVTANKFIRGDDVGVKSFSWEFVGSDPFTATREVAASLHLTAQHFSSFARLRTSSNVIAGSTGKASSGEYRYLDLVLQPDCRDQSLRAQNYNNYVPECYRVRVEVGYNSGKPKTFGSFTSDGEFSESVSCHTDILILNPTDHKFEYNDDGSVDLVINFRGSLDALMNDKMMNILIPNGDSSASGVQVDLAMLTPAMRSEIKPILLDRRTRKNPAARFIPLDLAEESLKYVKANKKNIDGVDGIIETLSNQIAKTFVTNKQLFMAHIFDKLDTNGAIFSYGMTRNELRTFTLWQTDLATDVLPNEISLQSVINGGSNLAAQVSEYSSAADNRILTAKTPVDFPLPGQQQNHWKYKAAQGNNVIASLGDGSSLFRALASNNQEELNKNIEKIKQLQTDSLSLPSQRVNYFFLGDLLAVVFDSVTGEDSFDSGQFKMDLLTITAEHSWTGSGDLGEFHRDIASLEASGAAIPEALNQIGFKSNSKPLTTKNILKQFRIVLGCIEAKLKATGNTEIINLAHIPISVQLFNQFMIDNILSKDETNYSFFQFINHVISDLVIKTLGTKCFGGLIDTNLSTQTLLINSPKNLESHASFIHPPRHTARAKKGESAYQLVDPRKIDPNDPVFGVCNEQVKNILEYIVIGAPSSNVEELNGDYINDTSSGIYHLGYGLDRGLVKTMKFAKTNQEFLPEAAFASEGGLLLNQLANAYDVTIEMVGNNLFKIGQYVYIDAEALGAGPSWADDTSGTGPTAGRKRSWANLMGLGGYHLVTEIANSISDNGVYTTTIKARYQSGGTRSKWDANLYP